MDISYEIMRTRVPSFNNFAHFENDFHAIRLKHKCDYLEKPYKRKGYYLADESGDCIFIDSRLDGILKEEVRFHELSHLILDHPVPFLEFRQHLHAQIFALVFMIPKTDLFKYLKMQFYEIDYRLIPYLKKRLYVYQIFGI